MNPTRSALDCLWARRVRERDKCCRFCGSKRNLDAAHIFNRWQLRTRWLLANGLILCRNCHEDAHNDRTRFEMRCYALLGAKTWAKLYRLANWPLPSAPPEWYAEQRKALLR